MTMTPQTKSPQRSALGLIVLWQLSPEPMHVYRMQKLFEAEGKDRIVNVRSRASLYQTIERLERLGLVEVAADDPAGGLSRPRRVRDHRRRARRGAASGCARC